MVIWSRREFLGVMASAGISTLAGPVAWAGGHTTRVGVVGWNAFSRRVARVFRDIPQLTIAAVADVDPSSSLLSDWRKEFPGYLPRLYRRVPTMLEQCNLDFVYVHGADDSLDEMPIHVLLEDPDLRCIRSLSSPSMCIQILPKYEFGGISRASSLLSGNWTHAMIDCRSALPATPFHAKSELASWLCREVGEAVDFVSELMDLTQAEQVFAAATPAVSGHQAKFGWRFVCTGSASRTTDLSVVATHSSKTHTGITITLTGQGQSVVLHAAPRSPRFTRFLICNLIDTARSRNQQALLYHPAVLKQSYDLVSRAAMSV